MPKKKTLARSSKTGKIVTKEFAEEHPATTQVEIVSSIAPLTDNFDREDLNKLRDKINEIIARG